MIVGLEEQQNVKAASIIYLTEEFSTKL